VTLARLSINRSLAAAIGSGSPATEEATEVWYAPAYARARALATNYLGPGASNLYFLREQLSDSFAAAYVHRSEAMLPLSLTFPMPTLGAWLMLSMPKQATMADYFSEIGNQRERAEFVQFRNWLACKPGAIEVDHLIRRIRKRLKVPTDGSSRVIAWCSLSSSRGPELGIKAEADVTALARRPWTELAKLISISKRTRLPATVLTGCLERLLDQKTIADDLLSRTVHLLKPIPRRSKRTRPQRGGKPGESANK
jgi:hypothetical protein